MTQPVPPVRISVERAVGYLQGSQLPDGEFRTEFRKGRQVLESGETIDELVFDSSPFVTALTVYSLAFARSEDPRVEGMIDSGCRFLLSEMEPGGLWRYWSNKNQLWPKLVIPPDLDDTCCVSQILQANGHSVPDNRGLVLDSRNRHGAFYTWLYKPNSLRKLRLWVRTRGRAFCYSNIIWQWTGQDDVCAVVNANVVHYLGESPATRPAIAWLQRMIATDEEANHIVFYGHPFALYYMLSKARFGGVRSLEESREAIVERLLQAQQHDGSFGDELLTAQALCTLANFQTMPQQVVRPAVRYLQSTQREDGSWRRIPMYGGPPQPDTFGSADLTTGVCLEALVRCGRA